MSNIKIGVAALIVNKSGNVLIVESPKIKNGWTLPGGHMEIGEKIEETAVREVKEEVGLNIKCISLIQICEVIFKKDDDIKHMISFHMLCETDNEDCVIDDREISNIEWVDPLKAEQLIEFEDFKNTLAIYNKKYAKK